MVVVLDIQNPAFTEYVSGLVVRHTYGVAAHRQLGRYLDAFLLFVVDEAIFTMVRY